MSDSIEDNPHSSSVTIENTCVNIPDADKELKMDKNNKKTDEIVIGKVENMEIEKIDDKAENMKIVEQEDDKTDKTEGGVEIINNDENRQNNDILIDNTSFADTSELNSMEKLTYTSTDSDSESDIFNKRSTSKKNKKVHQLIDSSSEPEIEKKSDGEAIKPNSILKRAIGLIDSDSSDGENPKSPYKSNGLSLDSDSNEESQEHDSDKEEKTKKQKIKKFKTKQKLNASHKITSDNTSSDSESDDSPQMKESHKSRPPQRMSAKEADEQMKTIQSESQRLAREAHINVPYHRPKQHTLAEFLSRKIINKSVPMIHTKKAAASIKMSKDELELYAMNLAERERESQEFFKSESDDDENDFISNPDLKEPKSEIVEKGDSDNNIEMPNDVPNELNKNEIDKETPVVEPETIEANSIKQPIIEEELQSNKEIENELQSNKVIEDASHKNENNEMEPTKDSNSSEAQKDSVCESKKIEIDYDFADETVNDKQKQKLNKLKEISPGISAFVPSIQGSKDCFIDLESGDITPKSQNDGVHALFERFMKCQAKKPKKDSTEISVINTSSGTLEIEKLNVLCENEDEIINDSRPRAPFFKLKEKLSAAIVKKRKEEVARKIDEPKKIAESENLEDEDFEMSDDNNSNSKSEEESDNENDKEENYFETEAIDEMNDGTKEFDDENMDDENEDEGCNDNSTDDENINLNEDSDSLNSEPKSRKRIIVADDSDDENEIRDFEANTVDDLQGSVSDEHLSTQPLSPHHTNGLFTQDNGQVTESQLLDMCSGTFSTQLPTIPDDISEHSQSETVVQESESLRLVFESSDEESEVKTMDAVNKTRKKVKALGYSDDEDDEIIQNEKLESSLEEGDHLAQENQAEKEDNSDDDESGINHDPTRIVEYDSEENEIDLTELAKVRKKKVSDFFEDEAELSESEWGSEDEDEKDLDRIDIELGDEDQFDQDKLQSELGRIHLRRVLDQDTREVKIIQEMLFENEENDGLGRERQFRWKNIDTNLTMRDEQNADFENTGTGLHCDDDDENEEEWRKMRHERNMLLKENNASILENETAASTSVTSTIDSAKKKITIVKKATNTPQLSLKNSPFLIDKSTSNQKMTRCSFLTRDQKTLSQLATLTKGTNDDNDEILMPSSLGKNKNFVFSTLTPVEKTTKRKNEDNLRIDNDVKKVKIDQNEGSKTMRKRLLDILA